MVKTKKGEGKKVKKVAIVEDASMQQLADNLQSLTEWKATLDGKLKDVNKRIADVNAELTQEMINQELQSFKRNDVTFYIQTNTYATDKATERDRLYSMIRERGFGDLVKEVVHPQTMKAFLKEQIEGNDGDLPDWLEGMVSFHQAEVVRMRKA